MADFFATMFYPFLACLLLAGIHVYLGIHVISRKVIFVDLALAQIAALGSVYGVLLGYGMHEDPWAIKGFSLAFAFLGAAVFALARMRHERVPQEAIIGITYAAALAATVLASAHLPHGADEVNAILAGSILWVKPGTVAFAAVLYALVGLFHYVFRDRFLRISLDPEGAAAAGINVRKWDFLFYMSFGFVVTSSVGIAGVLLVFSYLVIPAVVAVLFAQRIGSRLAIGWGVGTVASFLGVTLSYRQDLPSGPTIVVVFSVVLVCAGLIYYVMHTPSRVAGLLHVALGCAAVAALAVSSLALRKHDEHDPIRMLHSPHKNVRLIALRQAETDPLLGEQVSPLLPSLLRDPEPEVRSAAVAVADRYQVKAVAAVLGELFSDPDDVVREAAIRCIRHIGDASSVAGLLAAAAQESDEYLRVEIAESALELGDARGIPILISLMDEARASHARKDAHEHLSAHTRIDLPFNAMTKPRANDRQIAAFRRWWETNQHALQWVAESKIFKVPPP